MIESNLLIAAILGVVEGLTEFLPVSSTGHLIVAGSLLGYTGEKAKLFEIVIQAGAILAVCWEYRAKLFAPAPVAAAFIVGAIVIFWVERRQRRNPREARIDKIDDMRWPDALKIGIAQAFALIPGTSRSGATIIGGMFFGLSRIAATEFSFFLAIPTLLAATGYEFVRNRHLLAGGDLTMVGVGFVTAFVSAFFVVRALLRYVAHHDFVPFAWYRIAFGLVILGTGYTGLVQWS